MKKYCLVIFLFVVIGTFLCSCAGKTIQKTSPSFEPSTFNASLYEPKVDNFVVILDESSSMSDKSGTKTKGETAKAFLTILNDTLPELGYNGALIGFGPKDSAKTYHGLTRYSTSGFGTALKAAMQNPRGDTSDPLAIALNQSAGELKSTQGQIAVIIVSDGDRIDKAPAKAAEALKNQFGDRLCIYTILVGDSPAGKLALDQIAEAGGCGYATTAEKLSAPGNVAGFTEGIFLAKRAPRSAPKPVVKPVVKSLDSDGDGVTNDKDLCPNTPKGATVDARGCWTYAAEVLFGFDSTEINPNTYPMLDEAVVILKKNPKLNVEVDGHTDSTGPATYNLALSENRAKAVMKYFVDNGVNAAQLTVKGYGLTQPAASNDTREGRAKNRRVELKPVK